MKLFQILVLFLLLLNLPAGMGEELLVSEPVAQAQNLLVIYMIAGDLESNGRAATMNIAELLDGYGETSEQNLQIVIGYGGSKAPGFEGITYVTARELMEDASDGIIGNSDNAQYHNPDADMGDKETLENFLLWTGENFNADRKILLFWDHGGGYNGFGVDEATKLARIRVLILINRISSCFCNIRWYSGFLITRIFLSLDCTRRI